MKILNLLVILVGLTLIKVQSQGQVERIIADKAEEYGYPFEEHTVTTEDGYILTLHRIPHGLEDSFSPGRPAVLFQHGTYDSSDALVVHGPELSPAFYWANSGYDVWIANTRGNKYSLEHTTLTYDDPEYWQFSIVHMPRDHRANVQYIIDETGLDQISVIGFSAIGGAYLIAFNDDNDWWRERVNLFIGIGISTILNHTASTNFHLLTLSRGILFPTLRSLGIHYMFPSGYLQNPLFYRAWQIFPILWNTFELYGSEAQPSVDDQDLMQYYLTVFPSSSSLSFIENLIQIAISGRYQDFDYGVQRNLQEYGTPQPPEFRIDGFTGIPIAFIYGTLDNVISPIDVQWVISQIGDNLVSNQTYPYGHLTYFVGQEMEYLQDVVELLDQFNDPQIALSE